MLFWESGGQTWWPRSRPCIRESFASAAAPREEYQWDRAVGSWDDRLTFTTVWGGWEENFVGIDEFARLCEYIGAEPLICVRWTGKQPEDAAAEVEYANGSTETHWGRYAPRMVTPRLPCEVLANWQRS